MHRAKHYTIANAQFFRHLLPITLIDRATRCNRMCYVIVLHVIHGMGLISVRNPSGLCIREYYLDMVVRQPSR